jgi:hypothetical protein
VHAGADTASSIESTLQGSRYCALYGSETSVIRVIAGHDWPLKNFHFFDFRQITRRFFEELRTMFFGTNFYFLSFVREGYRTALLSQRLIAHDARSQRI